MRSVAAATALLSLAAAVLAQDSSASTAACPAPGGAHIIVARASTEAPGFGIIGAVKDQVVARVPGSTAEAVDYPATLTDYINSESDGVLAMKQLVNNFIANCDSNIPLVLLGYSQGAQVVMDTLVGQADVAFPANASIDDPLPDSTLSRVVAGVVMGDPTFNTTETFHVGNATQHGLFPRQDVSRFAATDLAARLKSYCDAGDPYCAGGSFSTIIVHLKYVQEYGAQAEDFIVAQIKDWYAKHPVSSSSGAATATSTCDSTTASMVKPTRTPVSPTTGAPYSQISGASVSMPKNGTRTVSRSSVMMGTGVPGTTVTPTSAKTSGPAVATGAAATMGGLASGAVLAGLVAMLL